MGFDHLGQKQIDHKEHRDGRHSIGGEPFRQNDKGIIRNSPCVVMEEDRFIDPLLSPQNQPDAPKEGSQDSTDNPDPFCIGQMNRRSVIRVEQFGDQHFRSSLLFSLEHSALAGHFEERRAASLLHLPFVLSGIVKGKKPAGLYLRWAEVVAFAVPGRPGVLADTPGGSVLRRVSLE